MRRVQAPSRGGVDLSINHLEPSGYISILLTLRHPLGFVAAGALLPSGGGRVRLFGPRERGLPLAGENEDDRNEQDAEREQLRRKRRVKLERTGLATHRRLSVPTSKHSVKPRRCHTGRLTLCFSKR